MSLAQLGQVGVARVSTGSAPYRRALAAALATAIAARDDTESPSNEVPYDRVQQLLQAASPQPGGS